MNRLPKHTCPDIDKAKYMLQWEPYQVTDESDLRILSDVCDMLEELRDANSALRDAAFEENKRADELEQTVSQLECEVRDLSRDLEWCNKRLAELEEPVNA